MASSSFMRRYPSAAGSWLGWVTQSDRQCDAAQVLVGEPVATASQGTSQVPLAEPFTASGSRSVYEYRVLQQRRLAAGRRAGLAAAQAASPGMGCLSLILWRPSATGPGTQGASAA